MAGILEKMDGKLDEILNVLKAKGQWEIQDNKSDEGTSREVLHKLEKELNALKRTRNGIQHNFPHENLRLFGCYFFCLLRWAEEIRGEGFNEKDIVPLFNEAQKINTRNAAGDTVPIINERCFVNDPVRLLNFLAGRNVVSRVAIHTNDGNWQMPTVKIFIMRETNFVETTHFVLNIDGTRWDSLPYRPRTPAGFRVLI